MDDLKHSYEQARASFIKTVDEFPVEKREEILFDKWDLRELVAHLSGWDLFLTNSIKNLKTDSKEEFPATAEGVNEKSLSKRIGISWNEIYKEFADTGVGLFKELDELTTEEWSKPLWSNNDMTTKDFLNILIGHINDEHLPLVKQFI